MRGVRTAAVGVVVLLIVTASLRCGLWGPPSPEILWTYKPHGLRASSPAVANDGTVYFTAVDSSEKPAKSYVHALDPDGTLRWRYETADSLGSWAFISAPAIGPDGTIYVGAGPEGDSAFLVAINSDGTRKWRYTLAKAEVSAPAIGSDGTIYFTAQPSYHRTIFALNPDGSLLWQYPTDTTQEWASAPSVGQDGSVYFGQPAGLCALTPSGQLAWKHNTEPCEVGCPPAVGADGTLYFGASARGITWMYALNPDGTPRWQSQRPVGSEPAATDVWGTPSLGSDGTVYFTLSLSPVGGATEPQRGYLYALDADGKFKWEYTVKNSYAFDSPAIDADGTIYFGAGNGFYAVKSNGRVKWCYDYKTYFLWASPAIGPDGTIYSVTWNDLFAVEGSSPLDNSPWPKYQHDNKNTGRFGAALR